MDYERTVIPAVRGMAMVLGKQPYEIGRMGNQECLLDLALNRWVGASGWRQGQMNAVISAMLFEEPS